MTDQQYLQNFDTLYEHFFDPIYRFVYRRVSDKEIVRDIVSETFLKVYKNLSSFIPQKGATLSSWIYTIARNEVFQYYRKNKHASVVALEDVPEIAHTEDPTDIINEAQTGMMIQHLLQQLETEDRDIILMKYFDGLHNNDIATMLDITANNVGVKLFRALQKLKTICLHNNIDV